MTLVLAARRQIGYALGRAAGGLSWLLRDDFTTDLPAGSVNGTAAEPGPGTRTVHDIENKISIAEGKLQLANQATPSWYDEYLYYAGITRVPGRILCGLNYAPNANNALFGWSNSQTPNGAGAGTFEDGFYFSADAPYFAYGTDFGRCVVLRQAGAMRFAKGGTLATWHLQSITNVAASSTLYPAVSVYNTPSGNIKVGYIRVPDALWLPTPLASDGFGSAFGTTDGLGHAEGIAGGIGAGGSGVAWSNVGSTWSVSGGKAINTAPSGLSQQISVLNAGTADVFVGAALTRSAAEVGLALNIDSASSPANGVLVYLDGTNCKVDKIVGGVTSNVRTTAVTYSAGQRLVAAKIGSEYRIYYGVALVGALNTISDAGIVSNTLHGLYSTNVGNTLNDYTCYATGTGGEYAVLDTWSS